MVRRKSVMGQLILMIKENKAYWLFPIIGVFLVLILLAIFASVGGGVMSPFVYTLF